LLVFISRIANQRLHGISFRVAAFALLVFSSIAVSRASRSSASSQQESQPTMSGARTQTNSGSRLKISDKTRHAYKRRDKSLDRADPDAPVMPARIMARRLHRKMLPDRRKR
jgi:hypothetical protein